MTKKPNHTTLSPTNLEEVIMDVANLNTPEESADRVADRTLDATRETTSSPPTRTQSRSAFIALGTAALVLCVVVSMVLNFSSGNVAFAQVQQELQQTESLQYVEYFTEAGAQARLEQAENQLRMMSIEVNAMKESGREISENVESQMATFRTTVQELKDKIESGDPVVSRRVWIQGRFLHRSEHVAMGSPSVHITNAQTGESVTLDRKRRSCTVLKTQTVMNMQTGKKKVTDLGPNPAANFYAAMTEIPPGDITRLGEKQIAGKQTIGFEQTEDLHDGIIRRTYWIGKETKLPVQIEGVFERDGVALRGTVVSDMVFNQEIDKTMFDTTPPEGYTVQTAGFMSLDPGEPAR